MYRGIFEVAETDDELAAVLSHEISHVFAQNREATASQLLIDGFAVITALPFVLGALLIEQLVWHAAAPLATGALVMLPRYSGRAADTDGMGMMLMTQAGFDPPQRCQSGKR